MAQAKDTSGDAADTLSGDAQIESIEIREAA